MCLMVCIRFIPIALKPEQCSEENQCRKPHPDGENIADERHETGAGQTRGSRAFCVGAGQIDLVT
jgi:hypothetical protein